MADRTRSARQRKHWHLIGDQLVEFAANGTGLLGSFTAAGGEPFTFIRGLGELSIAPNGSGVVGGDACVLAAAIGVVSADAIALGVTALPDPAAEPDYPWLWWYQAQMQFPTASGSMVGLATEAARIRIETKAMRRLGPREGLILVAEYVDLVGTPPIDVVASARFLVGTS